MKGFRLSAAGLLAAVCLAAAPAAAQGRDVPPAPDRWVTDRAGFLSASAASALDARLEAFERETGSQVLVYIDRTTGVVPIEDFAVRAFEAWKVGRKGLDDGVILFVMADDRKLRIEVGYGLEAVVTDLRTSRIIRDVIVPRLQAGDNDAAVTEGAAAIVSTIRGEPEAAGLTDGRAGADSPTASRGRSSAANRIFTIIAVIFFIILFITNPRLAMFLLWTLMSGGRGGGGGGGRGGFRGGGGRSGGGGASGSW